MAKQSTQSGKSTTAVTPGNQALPNIAYLVFRRMRAPIIFLISVYAISILGLVLIPGMDDQGQPWKMSFFHAFYFVSFMGSTIGFGEIPYPFTDGQRLWTLFTIYATVISWLYTIGTMLTLIQSVGFQQAVSTARFARQIRRIHERFYIICGYGDTGRKLIEAFQHNGQRAVVIDAEHSRIDELELEDWPHTVPALVADAGDARVLEQAGILSDNCKGVIAVTRSDPTNLQIAISARILDPNVKIICRAETKDAEQNMLSFGTDLTVNPHETFADDFELAMSKPSMFLLEKWITASANTPLIEPVFPPKGRWVLCGYGRFGKAIYERLLRLGNPATVIEAKPAWTQPPESSIIGRGTEADTLEAADIQHAVGIVAGTNNDVNNLSIQITARQLNPGLFCILRQERASNRDVSYASRPDMLMDHSYIISSRILEVLITPLTGHFLRLARERDDEWARVLISRLAGITDDTVPDTWVLSIRKDKTPAIWDALRGFNDVLIGDLLRDPNGHGNIPCIPLLLQRKRKLMLLPDEGTPLKFGDRILFCGQVRAQNRMDLTVTTHQYLYFNQTGVELPSSWLLKKLFYRSTSDTQGKTKANGQ